MVVFVLDIDIQPYGFEFEGVLRGTRTGVLCLAGEAEVGFGFSVHGLRCSRDHVVNVTHAPAAELLVAEPVYINET